MRRLLAGFLIGIAAAILAGGASSAGLLDRAELNTVRLADGARRVPANANPDIVLVEINDTTLHDLAPFVGRWPWPRFVHGQVVDLLRDAGATVIVYDVLFTERDTRTGFLVGEETWTGAESDRAFADAARAAGNVVFAAEATSDVADAAPALPHAPWTQVAADDSFEPRPSLTMPYPELAAAARALGHNVLVVDADGPVRRSIPFVRAADHGRAVTAGCGSDGGRAAHGRAGAARGAGAAPGAVCGSPVARAGAGVCRERRC